VGKFLTVQLQQNAGVAHGCVFTYKRMQCPCRFQDTGTGVLPLCTKLMVLPIREEPSTDLGLRTMFLLHDKSKHPEFHQP